MNFLTRLILPVLLILAIFQLQTGNIIAQIVSSPLDPTEPSIMPATVALRSNSSIGVDYYEQSGTRFLGDQNIFDQNSTGSSLLLIYSGETFGIEAKSSKESTTIKLDQSNEGELNFSSGENRLNLALLGDGFVAIGLGGRTLKSEDYIPVTMLREQKEQTGILGSFSLIYDDTFIVGGGVEQVKEKTSYSVDNGWNEFSIGGGILAGDRTGTQVRLELSYTTADKSYRKSDGVVLENKHDATTTTRVQGEVMFGGLLFSAYWDQKIEETMVTHPTTGALYQDIISETSKGGVLWIPPEGMMLGFYFVSKSVDRIYFDEQSAFQIKVGMLY